MRIVAVREPSRSCVVAAAILCCSVGCSAPPREYTLVSINGHPLPVIDSVDFGNLQRRVNRVIAGALSFVRADTMRVEQTNYDLFTASWPCSVLRMASKGGSGGMTATGIAATDTSTTGCEELRTSHDTTRLAVEREGNELLLRQVFPIPYAAPRRLRAKEHGDTLVLTDSAEGVRPSPQTMVYVKLKAPSA